MKQVFVDTSGIVGAINAKDDHHQQAKEIFLWLAREHAILVITNYIRIETHALLNNRINRETALKFLNDQIWNVEWITPEDEARAIKLLQKHSDKTYSLTDATSFVVMERLGIQTAVAFDQHFIQYGFYPLAISK